VLPFLLDDQLVARIDLKADRHAGILRVQAAYHEDGVDTKRTARELTSELQAMAQWLNLSDIHVQRKGNLASELRRSMK
jgi:uncharacterized protein YcaQ